MSTSIQPARIGALQAYHDANGPILYGFEPFFKDIYYPATTMLKDIGDWEPLGMLTPRFSCVNQVAFDNGNLSEAADLGEHFH